MAIIGLHGLPNVYCLGMNLPFLFQLLHMDSTSANVGIMNNSLKLILILKKDDAVLNILSESNIDSLYYGNDDVQKCGAVKRNHNTCCMHLNIRSLPEIFDQLKLPLPT